MKRYLFLILLVFIANFLYSQNSNTKSKEKKGNSGEATITYVEGAVDIKLTEDSKWEKAEKDTVIKKGAVISTGINSKAIIEIKGVSIIMIRSLTQFVFEELDIDKNKPGQAKVNNNVNLKLKIGTVKVKVQKTESSKTSFKVTTPKGTASVRGTIEEIGYFPGYGISVECFRGEVELESLLGDRLNINKDQSTDIKEDANHIISVDEKNFETTRPETYSFDMTDREIKDLDKFGDPRADTPGDNIKDIIRKQDNPNNVKERL